jgi:hypothetical protein
MSCWLLFYFVLYFTQWMILGSKVKYFCKLIVIIQSVEYSLYIEVDVCKQWHPNKYDKGPKDSLLEVNFSMFISSFLGSSSWSTFQFPSSFYSLYAINVLNDKPYYSWKFSGLDFSLTLTDWADSLLVDPICGSLISWS